MNNTEIIIIAIVSIIVLMYVTGTGCSITCGKTAPHMKEGMTAGLGTINGLGFNNQARVCSYGNEMGSSSPHCATVGPVLF